MPVIKMNNIWCGSNSFKKDERSMIEEREPFVIFRVTVDRIAMKIDGASIRNVGEPFASL